MTKRCQCCGQFFTPDKRVFKRQKACQKEECRKALKLKAQKRWRDRNPEYTENHYRDYIISWRQRKTGKPPSSSEAKTAVIKDRMPEKIKDGTAVIKDKTPPPMIKDEIPHSNAVVELVLLIPGDAAGVIKDEIRLRKVGTHRFAAYG